MKKEKGTFRIYGRYKNPKTGKQETMNQTVNGYIVTLMDTPFGAHKSGGKWWTLTELYTGLKIEEAPTLKALAEVMNERLYESVRNCVKIYRDGSRYVCEPTENMNPGLIDGYIYDDVYNSYCGGGRHAGKAES